MLYALSLSAYLVLMLVSPGECTQGMARVGVMVPLQWGGPDSVMEPWAVRYAASAAMAAHHVNNRVDCLVPSANDLVPANFSLDFSIGDSNGAPAVAVDLAVEWNADQHAIIGSYRSAVTGPLALVASIDSTPVIAWGATASSLSDRITYPTLSRSVSSDAVLAEGTIRSISSMGWTRISILYVNDAWGREWAQEASASAVRAGVEVVIAASFSIGDNEEIEEAVSQIAHAGTRITVCVVFGSDLEAITSAADSHGMLRSGYAWVTPHNIAVTDLAAVSLDPVRLQSRLTGWMVVSMDPLYGELFPRFRDAMDSEPLEHLNKSILEGAVSRSVITGSLCGVYCGTIYDAVWTAAIATGRAGVAADGSVDKAALLREIRNVSFQGATGWVQYDTETGERDASEQPLIIKNVRPVSGADGGSALSKVPAWRWQSGVLEQESSEAPIWPGGEQAWVLPHEVLECDDGFVFSSASLQCEACPKGTSKEGNSCVRYDASVGVMVPLRWGGPESAMEPWAVRYAASAAMAAHHINHRVTSLVPEAEELLPAGFKLVFDIGDSMGVPSVAVNHAVEWNDQDRHAMLGSYRSAVTGPLALVASIEATPVIAWGATASSLSDRDTYPTMSRSVPSDAVLAEGTIRSISSMGWTRIAILYVNDAWGRGYFREALEAANAVGVDIVVAPAFALGDAAGIESAVRQLSDSGARITLCLAFNSDLALIADTADKYGMLNTGYAWIVGDTISEEAVLLSSTDPARTRRQVTGWLTATMDLLQGEKGPRFQDVLLREPLEHLNKSILTDLTESVISNELCGQFCGTIYDAVWTAAIAIGRAGVAADGSVDKAALLREIRNVSFQGATGWVQYDTETGERDASEQYVFVQNVQLATDPSGVDSLAMSPAWRYQSGVLERQGSEAPIWPGGEQAWVLPHEVLECDDGFVFSSASLQCEACPKGTSKEGNSCVRYDASVGVMVPLRWGGPESAMEPWAVRYAASAAMAAHHINHRMTSLVPEAEELLPAGFKLVFDIGDSMGVPSVAVNHAVEWNDEGRHAIVGSYRSAVTGPLALVAAIEATPVIAWGATSPSLSDRDTYPTVSRTVLSDAVVAEGAIRSISSMGWSRIAILYVNDAWGRGFFREALETANEAGVKILAAPAFALGDEDDINDAVAQIAHSGARIIFCMAFSSDYAVIADTADRYGLLRTGFAWIITGISEGGTISASKDPARTRRQLTGWLTVEVDQLYGERKPRFESALHSEPLEHLNKSVLSDLTKQVITSEECGHFCATIYDAVWAAAIAIGRVGTGVDGSIDRAAVVTEIVKVEFDGATGRVAFDERGERDASDQVLTLQNVQWATDSAGAVSLSMATIWTSQAGALARESTEPPVWPGGEASWTPPDDGFSCAPGSRLSADSGVCEPCPVGTHLVDDECQPCPLGTFSDRQGQMQCSGCQVGYANQTGMTFCHLCPANSARGAGSLGINMTECLCMPGFFSLAGSGHACEACVVGGQCAGGLSPPYPMEGFWGDSRCDVFGGNHTCEEWGFLECEDGNCMGGGHFECYPGRKGRLCQEAEEGWFIIGGTFYEECGRYGALVNVVAIVVVVTCWTAIELVVGEKFAAVSVVLLFIQMASIIGEYRLRWHDYLSYLNLGFAVADFDVDFVEPLCIGPWSSTRSFYLQLFLPFIFNFVSIAIRILQLPFIRRGTDVATCLREVGMRGLKHQVVVAMIVYHTQCIKCFEVFSCTQFPDGNSYFDGSPTLQCWTQEHIGMVVTSVLYIPVLIAFPIFNWRLIRTHQKQGKLHDRASMDQWGFLHSMFENEYKWWNSALLFRRLAISFISVLTIPTLAKAGITIIVLTFLLAVHVFTKPFLSATVDILDFSCLCGLIFYTMAGMLMFPTVTSEAQGLLCSQAVTDLEIQRCAGENTLKQRVALSATVGVGLLLAIAGVLTRSFVRETRDGAKAYQRLVHLLKGEKIEGEVDPTADLRPLGTANKVGLDQTMHGTMLHNWVMGLKGRGSMWDAFAIHASAESFMVVAEGVKSLSEDVSQFSDRPMARIVRHLCEYPGLLELLLWRGGRAAQGLLDFLEAMVEFESVATQSRQRGRLPPDSPYKVTDNIVKFEHRPVLALYLLTASPEEQAHMAHLVDAVLAANDIPVCDALRGRTIEATNSGGTDTDTDILRPVQRGASTVVDVSFRDRLRSWASVDSGLHVGAGVGMQRGSGYRTGSGGDDVEERLFMQDTDNLVSLLPLNASRVSSRAPSPSESSFASAVARKPLTRFGRHMDDLMQLQNSPRRLAYLIESKRRMMDELEAFSEHASDSEAAAAPDLVLDTADKSEQQQRKQKHQPGVPVHSSSLHHGSHEFRSVAMLFGQGASTRSLDVAGSTPHSPLTGMICASPSRKVPPVPRSLHSFQRPRQPPSPHTEDDDDDAGKATGGHGGSAAAAGRSLSAESESMQPSVSESAARPPPSRHLSTSSSESAQLFLLSHAFEGVEQTTVPLHSELDLCVQVDLGPRTNRDPDSEEPERHADINPHVPTLSP